MADTFGWLDVERIAEELADTHPGLDPLRVGFMDLKALVVELEGFVIEPGARAEPTERILEAIQAHWAEEVGQLEAGDDD